MVTTQSLKSETLRFCHGEPTRENFSLYTRRLRELDERSHQIMGNARRAGRDTTQSEKDEMLALMDEQDRINSLPQPLRHRLDGPEGSTTTATTGTRFLTKDGREIRALAPHERLADLPQPDG